MNVSPSELTVLLNTSLQRLAAQSAACKLWSIVLTSLVLAMAAGRAGGEVLTWSAAPILLLALTDASYTAQSRRLAALADKEAIPPTELFRLQTETKGFSTSIQYLSGLGSFSVWPFYTVLSTMVIVLGLTVLPAKNSSQPPPIMSSPYQPGTPRPAYTMQQGGGGLPSGVVSYPGNPGMQSSGYPGANNPANFQPSNQTVTRPNIPPMGIPVPKPHPQGIPSKQGGAPNIPPPNNLPTPTK